MRRRKRYQAGASLLEVLVAFALLALSLTALIPALSGLTTGLSESRRAWAASEFAVSLLDRVGTDLPLEESTERGLYRSRWDWSIRMVPYTAPDIPIGSGLMQITVQVRDTEADRQIAEIVTLRRDRDGAR